MAPEDLVENEPNGGEGNEMQDDEFPDIEKALSNSMLKKRESLFELVKASQKAVRESIAIQPKLETEKTGKLQKFLSSFSTENKKPKQNNFEKYAHLLSAEELERLKSIKPKLSVTSHSETISINNQLLNLEIVHEDNRKTRSSFGVPPKKSGLEILNQKLDVEIAKQKSTKKAKIKSIQELPSESEDEMERVDYSEASITPESENGLLSEVEEEEKVEKKRPEIAETESDSNTDYEEEKIAKPKIIQGNLSQFLSGKFFSPEKPKQLKEVMNNKNVPEKVGVDEKIAKSFFDDEAETDSEIDSQLGQADDEEEILDEEAIKEELEKSKFITEDEEVIDKGNLLAVHRNLSMAQDSAILDAVIERFAKDKIPVETSTISNLKQKYAPPVVHQVKEVQNIQEKTPFQRLLELEFHDEEEFEALDNLIQESESEHEFEMEMEIDPEVHLDLQFDTTHIKDEVSSAPKIENFTSSLNENRLQKIFSYSKEDRPIATVKKGFIIHK